jgi:hypothetical protein
MNENISGNTGLFVASVQTARISGQRAHEHRE